MFIKKTYQYSKPLAIGMLFFTLVQLFCFYKGGMVFSPWYNYGMYSERIAIKPLYVVDAFPAIEGNNFSPQKWDKVFVTLKGFRSLSQNDSLYKKEISRLFHKAHLPIPHNSNFLSNTSSASVKNWFQNSMSLQFFSQQGDTTLLSWDGEKLALVRRYYQKTDGTIFWP